MPQIKYPESESRQGLLMFTVLFGGFILASQIQNTTLREVVAFGAYLGFIGATMIRGFSIRLEASEYLALADTCRDTNNVPHDQLLLVKEGGMILRGTFSMGGRDWWGYEIQVAPHNEKWMTLPGANFGTIKRHFLLFPDRADKIIEEKPIKNALRYKGEGPFNHSHYDKIESILYPLPHKDIDEDVPVQFVIMGSKNAAKMVAKWDKELTSLNDSKVREAVDNLWNSPGIAINPVGEEQTVTK